MIIAINKNSQFVKSFFASSVSCEDEMLLLAVSAGYSEKITEHNRIAS
jgi:hypothetical protein